MQHKPAMQTDSFGSTPSGRDSGVTTRQLVASLPGVYLLLSPQLVVEAVSNHFLEHSGLQPQQVTGRYPWQLLIGPDAAPGPGHPAAEWLKATLAGARDRAKPGYMYWPLALPRQGPGPEGEGPAGWQLKALPVTGEAGITKGVLLHLEAAGAPAAPPEVDLEDLLYVLVYELAPPIKNLEGLLKVLRKKLPGENETIETILGLMAHATGRLKRTQRELPHWAKAGFDAYRNERPASLPEVAAHVMRDLETELTRKMMRVAVDFPFQWMNCRRNSLYQFLSGLLGYALDQASPEWHFDVKLSGQAVAGYQVMVLEDQGGGMPYRQEMDLRLVILSKMAFSAGGRLQMEQRANGGLMVKIYLPAQKM